MGKGESLGLSNRLAESVAIEVGVHVMEVCISQGRRRIREIDNSVEPSRTTQNRRIKEEGLIRRCDHHNPLACCDAVEAVQQILQTHICGRFTSSRKCAIQVFEENHGGTFLLRGIEQVIKITITGALIKQPHRERAQTLAAHHGANGSGLTVAWRTVKQIPATVRNSLFAEPRFTLPKGLKIVTEQRGGSWVEDKVVPTAMSDRTYASVLRVETCTPVATVEILQSAG